MSFISAVKKFTNHFSLSRTTIQPLLQKPKLQENDGKMGITQVPFAVVRRILDFLNQPKDDTCFRMTCGYFKDCYPYIGNLFFPQRIDKCTRDCNFDRTIKKYIHAQCVIYCIDAREIECTDKELIHLKDMPLTQVHLGGRGIRISQQGSEYLKQVPSENVHTWIEYRLKMW